MSVPPPGASAVPTITMVGGAVVGLEASAEEHALRHGLRIFALPMTTSAAIAVQIR
jgi:hypothetical protein